MAVLRELSERDLVDYFATAALFCGIAATVVMLKFGGFRATIKFGNKDKGKKEEDAQPVARGIYRSYKEEFYGNGSMRNPQKKLSPSMVKLPAKAGQSSTSMSAKSVPDLRAPPSSNQTSNNTAKSTVDVSQSANKQKLPSDVSKPPLKIDPKTAKNQEKEMMKLEKRRLEEHKKQEKIQKANVAKEAKERAAREAKQKKEREKAEKERLKKERKKPKGQAPPPPPLPNTANASSQAKGVPAVRVTNPLAKSSNPVARSNQAQSTDTIESINRSSGPPPYAPVYSETVPNQSDNTGNTSFGKPIEEGNSWDFISQHREQMSKGTNVNRPIRKGANLQYSVGNLSKVENQGNSEA